MSQWNQETRAKSLISRSSAVTQALMLNEARVGLSEYEKLQGLESKAVAAGATYEAARAKLQAVQVKRDEAERDLSALNSTCMVVCRIRGVAAALFEELDRGDPVGLASHLEVPVTRVDTIGPMLAEMLRHQRKVLAKCSTVIDPESVATMRALEELNSTLFHLEAGIATARALLATKGITVKFAVKTRPGKKAKANGTTQTPPATAAAPKSPGPTNGASSHEQPALPAVTMGGEPSAS